MDMVHKPKQSAIQKEFENLINLGLINEVHNYNCSVCGKEYDINEKKALLEHAQISVKKNKEDSFIIKAVDNKFKFYCSEEDNFLYPFNSTGKLNSNHEIIYQAPPNILFIYEGIKEILFLRGKSLEGKEPEIEDYAYYYQLFLAKGIHKKWDKFYKVKPEFSISQIENLFKNQSFQEISDEKFEELKNMKKGDILTEYSNKFEIVEIPAKEYINSLK